MSEPKLTTAAQIALLNAKIDANQNQNMTVLTGLRELVGEKLNNQDGRINSLEDRVDDHSTRLTKLEGESNKSAGARGAAMSIIVGTATVLGTICGWFAEQFLSLFK
ncbi:hypothetical protein [Phenylobacterium sp. SCN 70-31]|uniref:hypothetical protein n=1 Tax=Phenylobacterium sp. SCN 70-31 TaxID=1660129 RepID=UPI0025E108EF|nr:hypothetical protein [Phenylobacterium sp. SCN 70-31]